MAFSEIISDKCLKNGFKLDTNLSEIKGNGVNVLSEVLNYCSMDTPNIPIIKRILFNHSLVFNKPALIEDMMRKPDPVINAFATLGISDRNCNVKWLIEVLYKLHELRPLEKIVDNGPPLIQLTSPISKKIESGDNITFEISTISEAQIQWWKHYNGVAEIVFHQQVKAFATSEIISYKTKETDKGLFHIEVTCRGEFRKLSSSICVGDYKPIKLTPPDTNSEPDIIEMIPCPETDGVKRIALLVGIMNYKNGNQKLKAPETDISCLERVLLRLGFTVYCFGDLKRDQMVRVLDRFSNICEADNTNIFFYFAGHGLREKKGDNLELIDERMPIRDVLERLMKGKPKMAVALFDMCRDNGCEIDAKGPVVVEAIFPFAENLIVVMSTLPTQRAYEKKNGCENTSLIMKPLCDNLSKFGYKFSINYVLTSFITSCENIDQRPTLLAVAINENLGINISLSRITLKIEWMRIPENQEIMKSITIDSKIFHNFINIYINKIDVNNILNRDIYISSESKPEKINDGIIKINLFDFKDTLKKYGHLEVTYQIVERPNIESKYKIKILIPTDIISFL